MTRDEALSYKPAKNQHISETRLETGEVIIEYPVAVRPLIASLDDESQVVRMASLGALNRLIGENMGKEKNIWLNWRNQKR